MITANEALQQSKYVIKKKMDDEIGMIEKEIDSAISNGETHAVLYNKVLNGHTIDKLEEMGYKITTSGGEYNSIDTIIAWGF